MFEKVEILDYLTLMQLHDKIVLSSNPSIRAVKNKNKIEHYLIHLQEQNEIPVVGYITKLKNRRNFQYHLIYFELIKVQIDSFNNIINIELLNYYDMFKYDNDYWRHNLDLITSMFNVEDFIPFSFERNKKNQRTFMPLYELNYEEVQYIHENYIKKNLEKTYHHKERVRNLVNLEDILYNDHIYPMSAFVIDKNHENGPEHHFIYNNGVLIILNSKTGKYITSLHPRVKQIKRYPFRKNCTEEQIQYLLHKASENYLLGKNQLV